MTAFVDPGFDCSSRAYRIAQEEHDHIFADRWSGKTCLRFRSLSHNRDHHKYAEPNLRRRSRRRLVEIARNVWPKARWMGWDRNKVLLHWTAACANYSKSQVRPHQHARRFALRRACFDSRCEYLCCARGCGDCRGRLTVSALISHRVRRLISRCASVLSRERMKVAGSQQITRLDSAEILAANLQRYKYEYPGESTFPMSAEGSNR